MYIFLFIHSGLNIHTRCATCSKHRSDRRTKAENDLQPDTESLGSLLYVYQQYVLL